MRLLLSTAEHAQGIGKGQEEILTQHICLGELIVATANILCNAVVLFEQVKNRLAQFAIIIHEAFADTHIPKSYCLVEALC